MVRTGRRNGHWGRGGLGDGRDVHRSFAARGYGRDLLHLSSRKRFAAIALDCFLSLFKCGWRRGRRHFCDHRACLNGGGWFNGGRCSAQNRLFGRRG